MIKVNDKVVKLDRFPDGTLNIKGDPMLAGDTILISWHYQDDAEFMAVSFLTKYYQVRGYKVELFLPYVPNARMDRIENAEDIVTIKYFGEMINSLGFENVIVLDPHSNVTMAVIKNCIRLNTNKFANKVINNIMETDNNKLIMFYPDEGAMKRYSKESCMPYCFGIKKRDWRSGKILGLDVFGMDAEEIKGKNILIRDDICSKGGTFYHAAKKLKELGAANIYLMVTHCENNIHNGEFGDDKVDLLNTGLIKRVFTTDSIYTLGNSNMVTVCELIRNGK